MPPLLSKSLQKGEPNKVLVEALCNIGRLNVLLPKFVTPLAQYQ